jgi:hypothetical protein
VGVVGLDNDFLIFEGSQRSGVPSHAGHPGGPDGLRLVPNATSQVTKLF